MFMAFLEIYSDNKPQIGFHYQMSYCCVVLDVNVYKSAYFS